MKCACGAEHALLDPVFKRPEAVVALSAEERAARAKESDDLCRIGSDEEGYRFFVRCLLPVRVFDAAEDSIAWGVWAEVDEPATRSILKPWRSWRPRRFDSARSDLPPRQRVAGRDGRSTAATASRTSSAGTTSSSAIRRCAPSSIWARASRPSGPAWARPGCAARSRPTTSSATRARRGWVAGAGGAGA